MMLSRLIWAEHKSNIVALSSIIQGLDVFVYASEIAQRLLLAALDVHTMDVRQAYKAYIEWFCLPHIP